MRYLSRSLLVIGLGLLALVGLTSTAQAAETASSDVVIIREGVTIDDDLYAAGNRVLIEGVVEGDLIAFASDEIAIRGEVRGSVFAIAPIVSVSGSVGESLRASSSELDVEGAVGADVVWAGLRGSFKPASIVGGDVLIWAGTASLSGSIGDDLEATTGILELSGAVGGNVEVTVTRLAVTDTLVVGGDLAYRSAAEATGLENAEVGGVAIHKTPLPPNIRVRALGLLARFLTALFLTATALLVAWGWPEKTRRAASQVREHPFKAYGIGALIVFSPVVIAGAAGVLVALAPAFALPLLVILGPLVVALSGVLLVLSLVAGIPAVLKLGEVLPGDFGVNGSILAGSALASLVWMLPFLGWLVPLLVLPLGLGAWFLELRSRT